MNTQDVTISVNLDAYCTRESPTEPYKVISALLNGSEIIDIIKKIPNKECEVTDQWIQEGTGIEKVSVELELECTFDSDGELDDVCLCCESIIDIIYDTIECDIYDQVRIDNESDQVDRAYEEHRERMLMGEI